MASSNTTTIVGVFNDYSKAEQAARELVAYGIPTESVHVQSGTKAAAAGRSDYQPNQDEGGMRGFFHRLFNGEETDTRRYSQAVEGGRSVVTVEVLDRQIDASVALLNEYGAIDISEDLDTTGNSIPVVDEQMKIGKRAVQRGGVRVFSQVVDRPVEESVTLREEHVRVDRRNVDRPITDEELSTLRDQTFEMTETVEEPVIEKQARVKEEIVLGKETTERTETVRDTVRHTDVKVERFNGAGAQNDYEKDFRDDWKRSYANEGGDYSMYAPSYDLGYRYASDPRYQGRAWNEVEPDLRRAYERDNPGGAWEKTKNAVRYGWDKVTGRP